MGGLGRRARGQGRRRWWQGLCVGGPLSVGDAAVAGWWRVDGLVTALVGAFCQASE